MTRHRLRVVAARIGWSSIALRGLLHPAPPDPDPVLPASVGEVGCGPDGEWCTGRPSGETAPVFVSKPRRHEVTW